MDLRCRGKWVIAQGPCNHSDQRTSSPHQPRSTEVSGATATPGEPQAQLRHLTPTGHPSSYQVAYIGSTTGLPNGSIATFKIAEAA